MEQQQDGYYHRQQAIQRRQRKRRQRQRMRHQRQRTRRQRQRQQRVHRAPVIRYRRRVQRVQQLHGRRWNQSTLRQDQQRLIQFYQRQYLKQQQQYKPQLLQDHTYDTASQERRLLQMETVDYFTRTRCVVEQDITLLVGLYMQQIEMSSPRWVSLPARPNQQHYLDGLAHYSLLEQAYQVMLNLSKFVRDWNTVLQQLQIILNSQMMFEARRIMVLYEQLRLIQETVEPPPMSLLALLPEQTVPEVAAEVEVCTEEPSCEAVAASEEGTQNGGGDAIADLH
ncbi:uncharacterized protein LOC118465988 [Anopheles albimanus]|uniref:uncharacterized protein LOC118465988 n=1 Tax=Anopheles albimanus TaxID=7167 RepID=UPI00163F48FA|nr:uncharacterized protein LOC118465988 [Anopheles albimanus]XP_035790682.1 uncharacterized protein LOC118465988 [Anopheles albimanus]